MPQRTKEEKAIYMKEWRELNKEHIKEQKAIYNKLHYQLNKEKKKQQQREYKQTEEGHKSYMISNWKGKGMILRDGDDWESVYYFYMATDECEQCDKVFQTTLDKHLDHCHTTRFIRDVVCNRCNSLRRFEDAKKLIWIIQQD